MDLLHKPNEHNFSEEARLEHKAATSTPDFDEDFYLFRHEDVRKAVVLGQFSTGRAHYDRYGKAEEREIGGSLWIRELGDVDCFYSPAHENLRVRTIADLNRLLIEYLPRLHGQVTAVVGIPRSGLLAANIMALHLNVPLMTIDDFLDQRDVSAYTRRPSLKSRNAAGQPSKPYVVVVDDSAATGGTMDSIKRMIASRGLGDKFDINYMAVFASKAATSSLNFFVEALPNPRVFEWNLLHHIHTNRFCIDMDGVLCEDPTASENDGGPKYLKFLENAAPKVVPSMGAGAIVTARLEKYRPQTEAWLRKHGIAYKRLIMLNLSTEAERTRLQAHAKIKASVLKTTRGMLFVESDPGQAETIHRLSGRPVYCYGTSKFYPLADR